MSRCFPYPPPGYEKKARSDQTDLLTKEKHKEKKHKKDKRDREKGEGKERKDKDRSKEKRKEKKDKKEKHRDKKKDKDKNRISNEGRKEEHAKGYDEEKVCEIAKRDEDIRDSMFVEELGRRIKDDEGETRNHMAATSTGKAQRRIETMGSTLEKERDKSCEMVQNHMGAGQRKIVGSGSAMDRKDRFTSNDKVQYLTGTEPSKIGGTGNGMEFGRKIRDEERGVGIQTVEDSSSKLQRSDGVGTMLQKQSCASNETVHNLTNSVRGRYEAMGKESATSNKMFHNFGTEQNPVGLAQSVEKDADKRIEGKEKTKERKGDRKGEKHKEGDRKRRSKGKDKDRDKEKEKEKDKMRNESEHKHIELESQRLGIKKEVMDPLVTEPSLPRKYAACSNGNHKRKLINGLVHENDMRPNKVAIPTSSSLHVENGRKIERGQFAAPCASDKHGVMNNVKVERVLDNEAPKLNGIINNQQPSVTLGHSLAETSVRNESAAKLPHPDSRYLSQILSVPKMEEWSESDEQEWLFGADNLRQRPETKFKADPSPQVWAEALRIEPADVLALPYVIPY